MVKAENIFKVTLNSAFIRKTMTFLSKCLSLMLTQTPCHKAAQCTSSGLIKAEHTEYRGTESQVYCFHSDIKFFFLCSSPVKWKKAQLHNEMIIIWPGFFLIFFFFKYTYMEMCSISPPLPRGVGWRFLLQRVQQSKQVKTSLDPATTLCSLL